MHINIFVSTSCRKSHNLGRRLIMKLSHAEPPVSKPRSSGDRERIAPLFVISFGSFVGNAGVKGGSRMLEGSCMRGDW